MSFHTANPSGSSHLFPCLGRADDLSAPDLERRCRTSPLLVADRPCSKPTALVANSRSRVQMNFGLERVCRCVIPSFARSPLRGLSRARRHSVFCFAFSAPSGSWFLPQQVCEPPAESAAQTSCGPLPECRPSALGSRAHSLGSAQGDPSNNG